MKLGTEGNKDMNQPSPPVVEGEELPILIDHDVTAALFHSLGAIDTTLQTERNEQEDSASAFPEHDNDLMETIGGDEPINWGELDHTEPGSIHEDELEGMFMALDEEGNELDNLESARLENQENNLTPSSVANEERTCTTQQLSMEDQAIATAANPDHSVSDLAEAHVLLVAEETFGDEAGHSKQCTLKANSKVPKGTQLEAGLEAQEVKNNGVAALEEEKDVTAALLDSLAGEDAKPSNGTHLEPTSGFDRTQPTIGQSTIAEDPRSAPTATKEVIVRDSIEPDVGRNPSQGHDAPGKKQSASRLCAVCQNEQGKYKCPLCSVSFCSVACNRIHKENHPPVPEKPPPEPAAASQVKRKREDDDPYSVLLEHQDAFQRLFKKYPNLVNELNQIGRATLPPAHGHTPMKHKNHHGFHKKQRVWTKEEGLRKGAAALRKARTDPSERGDAVREYCELVLHLLSKPGATEATRVVQEEVTAGDTKAIEQLMQEEKDKD